MEGSKIIAGHAYNKMQLLSEQMPSYQHSFEAYPIKRAWHLIQDTSNKNNVHCFIGAAYRQDRETWGIYTLPTSVELPILIIARTGELNQFAHQGKLSIKTLLEKGYTTIQYESVRNSYSQILAQLNANEKNILTISGVSADIVEHTVSMVESRRVDIGYVSYRYAKKVGLYDNKKFDLFNVVESESLSRKSDRILCSRSILGTQVVQDIDVAIRKIQSTVPLRKAWINILFEEEGYPDYFRSTFQDTWNRQYPIN